ncbi:MAG TPA: hypothetical protein VF229_02925, partial [Burkholderiaceae bacterium]
RVRRTTIETKPVLQDGARLAARRRAGGGLWPALPLSAPLSALLSALLATLLATLPAAAGSEERPRAHRDRAAREAPKADAGESETRRQQRLQAE